MGRDGGGSEGRPGDARGMPGGTPGIARGSPGDPPGIPGGPPGAGGRPGAFFRNRWPFPKVRGSCHIGLVRKRGALVSTKRQLWFIGFLWADTPINLLEFRPKYCPKIVEGIAKNAISELFPGDPRRSPAIPGDPRIGVTGRDTEPTFYTRRGQR